MEIKKQFLTASQVATVLGVSRQHIYNLINDKVIPSVFVGNRMVVPISFLREKYGVVL